MRQFISAVLLLIVGQVAVSQEAIEDDEQVVTSSETYDVQLYPTSPEGDSTALISFESPDELDSVATGGFEFIGTSASYSGSWFGFGWGPLEYRFGGAASEAGDNLMLSSFAFGEVLIGRAFTFASDWPEHYFVFGMMTDALATPEEGDSPAEDIEGGEPTEESTDDEVTVDVVSE